MVLEVGEQDLSEQGGVSTVIAIFVHLYLDESVGG